MSGYGRSIETARQTGRSSLFRATNVCDLGFESALYGLRFTFTAGDHAYVGGGYAEPPCHSREHPIKTPVQLERRETSATVVISVLCHIFLVDNVDVYCFDAVGELKWCLRTGASRWLRTLPSPDVYLRFISGVRQPSLFGYYQRDACVRKSGETAPAATRGYDRHRRSGQPDSAVNARCGLPVPA